MATDQCDRTQSITPVSVSVDYTMELWLVQDLIASRRSAKKRVPVITFEQLIELWWLTHAEYDCGSFFVGKPPIGLAPIRFRRTSTFKYNIFYGAAVFFFGVAVDQNYL
jgi:hypothetical protein